MTTKVLRVSWSLPSQWHRTPASHTHSPVPVCSPCSLCSGLEPSLQALVQTDTHREAHSVCCQLAQVFQGTADFSLP